MKTLSLFCTAALLASSPVFAAQTLYQDFPSDVTPELSENGEYQVGVTTLTVNYPEPVMTLQGQAVERALTLEVWYPTNDSGAATTYDNQTRSGKEFSIQADAIRDASVADTQGTYPVVVLSHGYTGYRTIMYYLGEHLASHGYIVAGIDHTDSTNEDVDFANAPYAGFPSTLLNRSRDQVLTLNAVSENTLFKDVADPKNAGLIGYSMGGFGTVNTVGGCYDFSDEATASFTGVKDPAVISALQNALNTCAGGNANADSVDERWKAAMALAPWGGQHKVFSQQALNKINVPMLYVAGDHDDISGYQGIQWLFENTGNESTKLLTFKNARHNIAPHPAPKEAFGNEFDIGHYLEPAWRSETMNDINEHFALAMMECHVKGKPEFCAYLDVEGDSGQVAVDGKVPEVWKGFDNRYALGLKMEDKPKR
ncbi:acetylhydrolase [Alteromonas sp. 1_MG-2023]|uniref:alpha/beta hydrolase family protein n=1 Tax=Alteromonas sp. 1_MG-2023 TaxID=3062669 RepID=UPI0026E4257B|nr:acetylhydrolase [Alteromonas sp. 1_MG-2023]MDO6566672.1 acetylhydrolase [Alteromonas sp. 1_MG-2023]